MTYTLSSLNEDELVEIMSRTEAMDEVTIILPPGELYLKKTLSFRTKAISHDAGCGDVEEKKAHIFIKGRKNFTLKGSNRGETVLLAFNDGKAESLKPSALWCEECDGLRVENLTFGFDRPTTFFGTVIEKEEDRIVIRPGRNDYPSVLPYYCMNRFCDGALTGPSLTIGFGLDNTMKKRDDGLFTLTDKEIADKVIVGDNLSWHLSGLTDFLIYIGNMRNLTLNNIRVFDASGFGILTESVENIDALHVVIKPMEGYQSVSRDGWKIFRCSGKVSVTSSHFEGTRMDGQNVHTNYMTIKDISDNTLTAELKYSPTPLKERTFVTFYGPQRKGRAEIKAWKILSSEFRETREESADGAAKADSGKSNRYNTYSITFDIIPSSINVGDTLVPDCMNVDEYHISDSVFKNIAGAANMVRAQRALIERNTYINIMNSAILIGAEWHTHCEGVNPSCVTVRDCTFINTGFVPRYGRRGRGAVAAVAEGFSDEKVIGCVTVSGSTFSSMESAYENSNAEKFEFNNNRYIYTKEGI